ncbi:MAG: heavy-metal-associated domain-containing protein [Flavobacterium sp.]|nr:heavy-metal-associated domain-containing protein [Flavobacterium sp.]MBP8157267.1 heavy-metal-associated domain-containing protein [Flavobacterium sp.]
MKALLKIQNLKCGGCANTITAKLEAIEAVSKVKVNVEDCEVGFDYTTDLVLAKAKETLKSIGYPEDGEANSIGTKAKSYVSCAIGKLG